VISELMRDKASPQVLEWIDGHPSDDLYISAVNRGEIERGLNLMPRGKRRLARELVAEGIFETFRGRCLAFEEAAAIVFGYVASSRIRRGRPISTEDAQIAAIALVHGMKVATRNTRDFADIDGLVTIDPWKS
jgi:predicted nucleic acid-binding protein